jgi:AGCS family alanine or glycine:cation symporter
MIFGTPSSFSMMMNELITQINDALWGYVLIGALVAAGLWFTWKTKGVQFRMVGEMF